MQLFIGDFLFLNLSAIIGDTDYWRHLPFTFVKALKLFLLLVDGGLEVQVSAIIAALVQLQRRVIELQHR